jgi:hypothetical protein
MENVILKRAILSNLRRKCCGNNTITTSAIRFGVLEVYRPEIDIKKD